FLFRPPDFVKPFLFGSNAAPPVPFLFGEENVRHPRLAPIELLICRTGRHGIAHSAQIGAALPAEFEIIGGLKTTSGTEHFASSEKQPRRYEEHEEGKELIFVFFVSSWLLFIVSGRRSLRHERLLRK